MMDEDGIDPICPGAISFPWPVMVLVWAVVGILFPFWYAAALVRDGKQLWVKVWDKVTGNHEFVRFELDWWDPEAAVAPFKPERAVCSCGWESPVIDNDRDALVSLFEGHAGGKHVKSSHS